MEKSRVKGKTPTLKSKYRLRTPYITSFSGLSIFIASSVFSSVCLQCSGGDFLLSLFELNYQNSVHVVVNSVGPLRIEHRVYAEIVTDITSRSDRGKKIST
jgi:hypothetical protein